jgi:hypothetical protein
MASSQTTGKEDYRVALYWSEPCKGHMLVSFGQWPPLSEAIGSNADRDLASKQKRKKVIERDTAIETEEIRRIFGGSLASDATTAYLREEIYSKIEQGLERITIRCKNGEQGDFAAHIVGKIIGESGGLVSEERIFRVRPVSEQPPRGRSITIDVNDDPKDAELGENGVSVDILDFRGLTGHMLSEVIKFLEVAIEALRQVLRTKETKADFNEMQKDFTYNEAYIDFLWAYNCRQLVIAGRYGLFCGVGRYTSVTAVALGSFYKLLEHAVDQVQAILQDVYQCLSNFETEDKIASRRSVAQEKAIQSFLDELIQHLERTLSQLKDVKEPLLNAIENRLSEKDKESIAKTIKKYHEEIKPKVGNVAETYIEPQGPRPNPMEEQLKIVGGVKAIKLAQTLYPLQKLCKFPANIAMLARTLNLSKAPYEEQISIPFDRLVEMFK